MLQASVACVAAAALACVLLVPGHGVHAVYMYNHDSTRWLENGQNYELHVRWQDCNVTGCLDTNTLADPVPCVSGYTVLGEVETECPRCDSSGRCPKCLPLDDHLCASFGLRVQDGNRTCRLFDVRRLYKIRRCVACHEACQDCQGPSASDCSSCDSRKVLVAGRCIEPWVFVLAGALSGILLCVIGAIILVIATRRKKRMEAMLSRNRKCSTSSRSDNSRWAEVNSISGLLVRNVSEKNAYRQQDALSVEPCHYSALPDETHSPLTRTSQASASSHYQPLHPPSTDVMDVGSGRPSTSSTRPSTYESLQPQAASSYSKMAANADIAAGNAAGNTGGNADNEKSFQQRLASCHYAPLRPPLLPTNDATYAHPSPSRPRAYSMYTGSAVGGRAADQATETSEAATRNTDYFATAPTRGRRKAKKPLPMFSRWSCIAPAAVDGRGSSGLHREPSWRFRAGPSQTDTLRKPDLWISSVTIGQTDSAVNTTNARPENPAVVLHRAAEKQLSDPLRTSHISNSDPSVHRTSSFSHSASAHSRLSAEHTGAKLSPLNKASPKSGRRFSPLISPLQIRKRSEKPAKVDKPPKTAKSNKRPKILPRWSMVPSRTLRLAEKRKQQEAWKNTASSSYEEAHVVSQLDTLSHYYHVLEKKQDPYDDFDERWQYGSNPSLSVRHPSQRVRKAMSLAPPGTSGRSQSLSRDDLLFVQSLVKECGLEGDHDIVVDDDITINDVDDGITIDDVDDDITIDDADHDITIDDADHDITIDDADHAITIDDAGHDITIDDADHDVTIDAVDHDVTIDDVDHDITIDDADRNAVDTADIHARQDSSSSSTGEATVEESSETESREATLSRLRETTISQEADDEDIATTRVAVPRHCDARDSDSDMSSLAVATADEEASLSQHTTSDDGLTINSHTSRNACNAPVSPTDLPLPDSCNSHTSRNACNGPVSPSDLPLPDSCSSDSSDSVASQGSAARPDDTLHRLQRGRLSNSQDFQMMAAGGSDQDDDRADFPGSWTTRGK